MVRYEKGHKGETRQHILDVASRRFRQGGLAQGISKIMKGAGLTHGGFYAHFRSKEDLIRESLLQASAKKRKDLADAAERGGLDGLVSEYLSEAHRDRPDSGCARIWGVSRGNLERSSPKSLMLTSISLRRCCSTKAS
jgi:TetR/AcrR family transcriptional regulator, transcriptional repressor for nem operon